MISAREKGFFQIFTALQVAGLSLFYWLNSVAVLWIYHNEIPLIRPYAKYWLIAILAMTFEALSRPGALRPTPGRLKRIAWSVTRRQWIWIVASITILLAFSQDLRISRIFLGVFVGTSIFLLWVSNRYLIGWFAKFVAIRTSRLRLRTLVMGPESWCQSIISEIRRINFMLEIRRVEFTDTLDCSPDVCAALVSEEPIDLLILPPRHLPDAAVIRLLRLGDRLGFRCWLPVELTRACGRRFDLQKIGSLDVLTPPIEPLENTYNQFIKRVFDLVLSGFVVTLILPPLCLLVLLIHRCHSPGPLFFKQNRVGRNGVIFQVYKFRSLDPDHGAEAVQVSQNDSRVFKGGAFLRKTSIDEMPQFWNVLKGEMSVVGPRPHMEAHDLRFRELFERYGVRRYVKPGVTGLAQVKGYRGEINRRIDLRNRSRLDNFYITRWDLLLDLRIVLMTGLVVIMPSRNAY